MTLITSLKALDVSKNLLEGHEGDGHLLAALPNLRTVTMLEQRKSGTLSTITHGGLSQ